MTGSSQSLRDSASRVRDQAAADGKTIKRRGPYKTKGKAEEIVQAIVDDRAAQRRARLEPIVARLLGGVSGIPGEILALRYGDHWRLPDQVKSDLEAITQLWVEERLNVSLEKPWMIDVVYGGLLVKAYWPGITTELRKRAENVDDSDPGRDRNGKDPAGPVLPPVPQEDYYTGPGG